VLTDESAIPSLPTMLNNAMYLIGELTSDAMSTRVLAEINQKFARIEDIISDAGLLESRARPSTLQRLEATRAALVAHRQRIERR
jgi:hypothetical protein